MDEQTNNMPTAESKHFLWTDELDAVLRRRIVEESKSFREIALELFGTEKARSRVLGRAYRIGLAQPSDNRKQDARRIQRVMQEKREGQNNNNKGVRPAIEIVPPDPQFRCTLMQLKRSSCRYPVGDPLSEDFRYCGRPGADFPDRPYCDHCAEWIRFGGAEEARRRAARK